MVYRYFSRNEIHLASRPTALKSVIGGWGHAGETNDGILTIITTDVLLRKTYECNALSEIDYIESATRGAQ